MIAVYPKGTTREHRSREPHFGPIPQEGEYWACS